ncbi:MAG: FAD-dependent thymidylate synthase [Candidatus Heimdallarchaeota archaeon]|nr:FAD-dependent thymidylate synthase [Candidatus Heimdallarchaeota archaeon]
MNGPLAETQHSLTFIEQQVDAYAHLPRINHPSGTRKQVKNPDLWFASKINATLKTGSASDVYWEKLAMTPEQQAKFVNGVRNHSWNRQHMGAMVVSGIDFEVISSSLVSNIFTLGKFYKMQQQTRRSVILDSVIRTPALDENDEVNASYQDRFDLYWDICERRPEKFKGFDPYIQDAFKILPLSTKTRFSGNLDLRTVKGYARWRNYEYLPFAVQDFASKLHDSVGREYPIMYKSYLFNEEDRSNDDYHLHLQMAEKIGSKDLIDEPMLWYADHSILLPENKYFNKLYVDFNLTARFNSAGPDAMIVGHFNPLGLGLEDLTDLFQNKDEATKSALELSSFTFVSKIDLSGAIDTWRHTRSNRMVQPIYHALEHGNFLSMPELHKRQADSGKSEIPELAMEVSEDAVKLYHTLVADGIPAKEAINVLPHNLEIIQIETMDIFAFLNIMAIRTCIHSRPDVQIWAKSLLRETGKLPDFRGLDNLSDEKSNLLARGIQYAYCMELGSCTKCGTDIVYLPDPYRG